MAERPKKRPTVLIVDDSTALLDELVAAFEAGGFAVASAIDGEEAFRKLTAYQPEAVLLDIYMPRISGTDVLRLMKAHPVWQKVYLVLMSGRAGDKEMEALKALGANDFLKKPFDAQAAVERVRCGLVGRP